MKNILLLDLGGVVVDLNIKRFHQALADADFPQPEQFFSLESQNDLFTAFETGKINNDDFLTQAIALFPKPIKPEQFIEIWCSMLDGVQADTIAFLHSLKKDYQLYALSNTNNIHIDYLTGHLQQQHSINGFNALFDGCHYSFTAGSRKPNANYFQQFFDNTKLDKSACLFIDDLPANTQAARDFGLDTITKLRSQSLRDCLKQI